MSLRPLLCELHAHTDWSDGVLSVRELVDLHGRHGFDVLCVTDHVVRPDDPYLVDRRRAVDEASWDAYVETIFEEAERARLRYDLLVIPGAELTDNHADDDRSAHALALGLSEFVTLEEGLVPALRTARRRGAVIVAAHPHDGDAILSGDRITRRFWREHNELRPLVDRYELFNQRHVFSWVAEEPLPVIAAGDFHLEHDLASWKTLVVCEKDEHAVLARLRSADRVYLTPFNPTETPAVRAA